MDRARLVFDLVMKMNMDVGSLISGQISQMAQSNSSRLDFPALITALCISRGVVSDSLTFESLSPAINLAYIKKNCWNLDDPTIVFQGPARHGLEDLRAHLLLLPLLLLLHLQLILLQLHNHQHQFQHLLAPSCRAQTF